MRTNNFARWHLKCTAITNKGRRHDDDRRSRARAGDRRSKRRDHQTRSAATRASYQGLDAMGRESARGWLEPERPWQGSELRSVSNGRRMEGSALAPTQM